MRRKMAKKKTEPIEASSLPEWVPYTERQWKALKRKQYNEALRAMKKLMLGCAYMPKPQDTGFSIAEAVIQMERAKKQLTRWWGKA
jgi:hypothetical protein